LPSRRASDSPIAIACFRLVTFLPLRPDFSVPRLNARISRCTSLSADGEYFRREEDSFAVDLRAVVFFALLFFELAFLVLDFLLAASFVAMTILPRSQMALRFETVASRSGNPARNVQNKSAGVLIPGADA
jgi:hypothetical protein